jgi:hypothetical protein
MINFDINKTTKTNTNLQKLQYYSTLLHGYFN